MTCSNRAVYAGIFFFNDTATTEIYTLSLHDALPISTTTPEPRERWPRSSGTPGVPSPKKRRKNSSALAFRRFLSDRKSTRLNSSHANISYAVFCLKKKNINSRVRAVLPLLVAVHQLL